MNSATFASVMKLGGSVLSVAAYDLLNIKIIIIIKR